MAELQIRAEDTSSDFHEPSAFNIAGAFPVTDEVVRKVEQARRRAQIDRFVNRKSLFYAAAALIGYAAVSYAFRR